MLEAPEIFINTGGRPTVPALKGLDGVPFLTSTGMMDIDFLPEHLIVIDVMAAGAPYTTISRAVHIHPTVAELIPTVLGNLRPLP